MKYEKQEENMRIYEHAFCKLERKTLGTGRFVVFIQLIDMAYVQEVIAKTFDIWLPKVQYVSLRIQTSFVQIHFSIFVNLLQSILEYLFSIFKDISISIYIDFWLF